MNMMQFWLAANVVRKDCGMPELMYRDARELFAIYQATAARSGVAA